MEVAQSRMRLGQNCHGLGRYEKDWMGALAIKTKNATFTLESVKLSTVHRKEKGKGKNVDEKAPRILGRADTIIHTRADSEVVWRL